jgi:diaminopimelate decarboxylase
MLSRGITPDRIIYANPYKQPDFVSYALEQGIYRMTLDSVYELEKIAELDPERRAQLVIRLRVDAGTSSIISFAEKFGATEEEALQIIRRAKELGMQVIGTSFHVGSMCYDAKIFESSIEFCKSIFSQAAEIGYAMHLVDIGGGFSGETFADCANHINKAIDQHFSGTDVEFIAEPGRYVCESAIDIYCRVIGKSRKRGYFHYIINDSIYNSFVSKMYDARSLEPCVLKPFEEAAHISIIWGNTCDSLDCITRDIYIQELHIGDWLVFRNYGAYGQPCEGFNGFKLTQKIYLGDEYERPA